MTVIIEEKPKVEPKKEGGSPVPPSGPEGGSENEAPPFGELAPRLELAIAQAGGPSAVARRAEMYLSTLHRYRGGRELPSSALVSLARATGVRLEWLATGEGPMQGEAAPELAPATPPGYVLLPLVEARAAAGSNGGLRSDHLVDFIAFSESFLKQTLRRSPKNLALLTASGDSMDPTIRDGDLLLVDTSARRIEGSFIYVLAIGGGLLVKRIDLRRDGSVILKSDNPKYAAEDVPAAETPTLQVLGQVIWQGGPVRS
jgi:phage repressor protein C with HTH and peptisase S24 domain